MSRSEPNQSNNRFSNRKRIPDTTGDFCSALKHWRGNKRWSQLDLALVANVSQRHISWLETGRSHPSREMVIRLCESIDIPLRERNHLLISAGYAPLYSESNLQAAKMKSVVSALNAMIKHHEPFPILVLDKRWNIQIANRSFDRMLNLLGGANQLWQAVSDNGEKNLARLSLHPNGLRRVLNNWNIVGPHMAQRIHREKLHSTNNVLTPIYEELRSYIEPLLHSDNPIKSQTSVLPVLPLEFALNDQQIRLFSMISTFGTPQDITTDELKIESFYPADETSRQFFTQFNLSN